MKKAGIDVGGTHADGVIMENGEVITKAKISVDQDNLDSTIITLLEKLFAEGYSVSQLHLSSTLCTNAIACNMLAPVGMLIQSGPGINPDFLDCGEHVAFLGGAIDHRGGVVAMPTEAEITSALKNFYQQGISSLGIVTKFSHRNPEIEQHIARIAQDFSRISAGHSLSGLPNFPRRVYTTWINAGLMEQFHYFAEAIRAGIATLGLESSGALSSLQILKADGGTFSLATAEQMPCEAVYSGPSASVMGALMLEPKIATGDSIVLDIGGTTTDIGLFAEGVPLMEPYGITVMGRPTLIRALNTRSTALGGDSQVQVINDKFSIVPKGSKQSKHSATLSDAMIMLKRMPGDHNHAAKILQELQPEITPEETAQALLTFFAQQVHKAVTEIIEEIFSRPVYAVSALLKRKRISPDTIVIVGGPAMALRHELEQIFAIPCLVPKHYEVANAIGAACTRPTLSASLYANSGDGTLSIPEIGLYEQIDRNFTMNDAKKRLEEAVQQRAMQAGLHKIPALDFIEEEEMNTVRGFSSTGKIIAVKAQIVPGLEVC